MVKKKIRELLSGSKKWGWVLEPDAKQIFSLAGLDIPRFYLADDLDKAKAFANKIGYPVVAKIVSPKVLHKSEVKGVALGIDSDEMLADAFDRFKKIEGFAGMLVEEMIPGGVELIIGAKMDYQFGPMILLGIGGVGVEIYRDTSLRMAPIAKKDALSMVGSLKASKLLRGYRGSDPIAMDVLIETLMEFSKLVVALEGLIASIDLNPVMCTTRRCIIVDARIILKT
jgi:acyl-CoA synthetase (NDP forming)